MSHALAARPRASPSYLAWKRSALTRSAASSASSSADGRGLIQVEPSRQA